MGTNRSKPNKINKMYIQPDPKSDQPISDKELKLLFDQYPNYQNIKYIRKNSFGILLQATLKKQQQVTLKIREHNQNSYIERNKEYELLKSVSYSEYIVDVNSIFYLKDVKHDITYEAIEIHLCSLNLRQLLQQLKNEKTLVLNNHEKEILAIQMLDAVNLLHTKNILHKNIKPESFLVSFNNLNNILYVLKLGEIRLTPQIKKKGEKFNNSQIIETLNYQSQGASEDRYRKQYDLFSLGIVLLELDNYETLNYTKDIIDQFNNLQDQGFAALNRQNLNSETLISKAAEIFLNNSFMKRKSAKELLALLYQQNKHENIPLYSVITPDKIPSFSIKEITNFETELKTINYFKSQFGEVVELQEYLDHIMMEINSIPKLAVSKLRKVMTKLYEQKKFAFFQLLGQGKQGIVFSVINLEQGRESALKISLVKDKSQSMRQIQVMNRCQSPYIVKFYSSQFVTDDDNAEYLVLEFEKCQSNLVDFLEQQTQEKQYSLSTKMRLAQQILDSIALLHKQNVVHGDIKLNSFLIQENEQGKEVIKLTNFNQAGFLNPNLDFNDLKSKGELVDKMNCLFLNYQGSLGYLSPERLNLQKPTTKLSDGFATGICLLLLDNYNTFSNQFMTRYTDLIFPYEKPYQSCIELFNTESPIFKWAESLLAYDPAKRLFPNEMIDNVDYQITPLYSKWNDNIPLQKECIEAQCLFLRGQNYSTIENFINCKLTSSFPSFITLKLDLKGQQIESNEVGNLFKIISQFSSLTSLELNLQKNQIGKKDEKNIYYDLSTLNFLEFLQLNLNFNSLTHLGAENIFKSVSMIKSLSSLVICLENNQIRNILEANIFTSLGALEQLQSLKLNLNWNKLDFLGVQNLFKAISKLTSLNFLELQLSNNQIGDEEVGYNIFSDLSLLTNLEYLKINLNRAQLNSKEAQYLFEIVSKLSSLTSLEIQLSNNQIGIEEEALNLLKFQSDLSQLVSLKISLNYNKLKCVGFNNLLKSISKIASLTQLEINLDNNEIQSEGDKIFRLHLSNLTQLTSLKLNVHENKLKSTEVGILLKAFSKLPSLTYLEMSIYSNQIGSEGEEHIQQRLSKLANLSSLKLNLFGNKLTRMGTQNLLKSISTLQDSLSLLELRLDNYLIERQLIENLFINLSTLKRLTSLSLSKKKLSNEGIKNLFIVISDLKSLSSLELQIGSFQEEENIFEDLQLLPLLSSLTLNLQDTNLTNKGVENIIKNIFYLKYLSSLSLQLQYNSIGNYDEGENRNIFEGLSSLILLTSLKMNLNYNKLTSLEVENLLKCILKLTQLNNVELHLWSNPAAESQSKEKLEILFSKMLKRIDQKCLFI